MAFDPDHYRNNHLNGRKCKHCGSEFWPEYAAQQYCSREDDPSCSDDRINAKLWKLGKHPLQNEETFLNLIQSNEEPK